MAVEWDDIPGATKREDNLPGPGTAYPHHPKKPTNKQTVTYSVPQNAPVVEWLKMCHNNSRNNVKLMKDDVLADRNATKGQVTPGGGGGGVFLQILSSCNNGPVKCMETRQE